MVGQASATVFCVNSAVTLQNELLGAAANGQDDEIRIVQGVYSGNFVYSSGEAKAIALLGGYTEGCASRALDPTNTILDGQGTGRVLALLAPDVAAEFTLEGLTLMNGKATAASVDNGGGLLANAGTEGLVTVRQSQILNNTGADGGGAYLRAGILSLTGNRIHDNESRQGHYGGGGAIVFGSADLSHNRIQGNSSTLCGGGVLLFASHAILTENLIEDNSSSRGGGVCAYNHFSITRLNHNRINNNRASEGGGIALYAPDGGAALLVANQLQGNSAASQGGGVWVRGRHLDVTFINNRLLGNSAPEGGGLYGRMADAGTMLINNTLSDNESQAGGGLSLYLEGPETATRAQLYNNLFWHNQAQANHGEDFRIFNSTASQVTLLANNFNWTPTTGFWVNSPVYIDASNLNTLDPQFVDAVSGDLRLRAVSPLIDAGYPVTPNLPAFDLGGKPRVMAGGVNVGAYESEGNDPSPILTLIQTGSGSGRVTSDPEGIDCVEGKGDCTQAYPMGQVVTLTATPAASSRFEGWSGACTGADPTCEVTLGAIQGVGATFSSTQPLLDTSRSGTGSDTLTPPEPLVVFSDSFESTDFTGRWVQDGQHDWFVSPRRATAGSRSAGIDGPTRDAQLTSIEINPQDASIATLKFDWFIASSLDSGEYLAFDVSINGGGTWTEMARLSGSSSASPTGNLWHGAQIGLTGLVASDRLRLRFRGNLSAWDEDANVDNLSVTVQ
ncbi:MAG: hypothetical protein IPN92_10985 [Chromatiaceae bacterium]|nr:hypothetical protein [Chromatiaceae bacterium]